MMNTNETPDYLDDTDPDKDYDFFRQDKGGLVTNHNGVADRLLRNNEIGRAHV